MRVWYAEFIPASHPNILSAFRIKVGSTSLKRIMDHLRASHSLGKHHRYSGWRRAALVNSVILIVLTALLLSCLIASITETGSVTISLFFFEGGCDGGSATQTNVALHLLLNIVSTAVFASSNFFMHVLNSPSREEVDRAHATGSYLGIGVPSMRNAFRVGRFKTVGWIFLLLSSIPMHLLFNSMIFQTDQRTGDFYLTIASETFLEGDKYYAPEASLAPGGLLFGDDLPDDFHEYHGTLGYGAQQNKTEYVSNTSDTWRNISAAAVDGGGWEKLSINDCLNSYVFCDGLKEYVDVILVVNQTDSWVRNSVWNTTDFSTDFWDPLIIAKFDDKQGTGCGSDCFSALGAKSTWDIDISDMTPEDNVWPIHFFSDVMEYVNRSHSDSWSSESNHFFSLNPGFADLSVDYCLAQPSERVCHVGLSNTPLLAITVCVFLKTREVRRARDYPSERLVPEPRLWRSDIHRRWGAVPSSVWASTYLLFFISIGIVAIFLPISMRYRGIYNNLFTRLQMAKEWSEFSPGYRPLLVTDPKWVHLNFTCRFWKMLINRRGEHIEMQRLINNQTSSQSLRTKHSNSQLTQEELFVHMSRSKLRWGIVKMPARFYAQFQGLGLYEHLSFGVEEDAVEPPVPGKYYG
ncbi:hypothetical protein SCUP234_01295 [Seiridium cupressi]